MTEIKENLRLQDLTLDEVNRVMGRLQDRLDAQEGLRGDPAFYADVDMQQKNIKNLAGVTETEEMTVSGPAKFSGGATFDLPPTMPIFTSAPTTVDLPNTGDMALYQVSSLNIKIAVNINGTIWYAQLTT